MGEMSTKGSLQYDYRTVRVATNNFSDANKLGKGSFGDVYKGGLKNGQEIVVKRLSMNFGRGQVEFENKVLLLAKLQHRNIVSLLGFCLTKTKRLLIYEFLPNGSLDRFIFDPPKHAFLCWDKCYKIIRGVARGLLYLHEDSRLWILHRDLKPSNILLDTEMNPKISDFGLEWLFEMNETKWNMSRIVGTSGYIAPEYATHGQFSVKSDVFSFGVLVLELISGERRHNFLSYKNVEHLLGHDWENWRELTCSNLIDVGFRVDLGSIDEVVKCIQIGMLCVQEDAADRPTMNSVVLMLNSSSVIPLKPAFFRTH